MYKKEYKLYKVICVNVIEVGTMTFTYYVSALSRLRDSAEISAVRYTNLNGKVPLFTVTKM